MRLLRERVPAAGPSPFSASAHGGGGPDSTWPGQGAVGDSFGAGATGASSGGPPLPAASIPVTGGGPDGDWASTRASPGGSAASGINGGSSGGTQEGKAMVTSPRPPGPGPSDASTAGRPRIGDESRKAGGTTHLSRDGCTVQWRRPSQIRTH
ncbi:unnamed protein product [Lampetra fluviatilis]